MLLTYKLQNLETNKEITYYDENLYDTGEILVIAGVRYKILACEYDEPVSCEELKEMW